MLTGRSVHSLALAALLSVSLSGCERHGHNAAVAAEDERRKIVATQEEPATPTDTAGRFATTNPDDDPETAALRADNQRLRAESDALQKDLDVLKAELAKAAAEKR
jgi:hypothetical protein